MEELYNLDSVHAELDCTIPHRTRVKSEYPGLDGKNTVMKTAVREGIPIEIDYLVFVIPISYVNCQ